MSSSNVEKYRAIWEGSSTIASQLPISFEGTNPVWEELGVDCGTCGQPVDESNIRGTISSLIPSVKTVEMVAWCRHCNILHRHVIRFRDDGSVESERDGKWVNGHVKTDTWAAVVKMVSVFWGKHVRTNG